MKLKKLLKSTIFIEIVTTTAALYLLLVRLTSIVKYENKEVFKANQKNGSLIYAIWHGRMIYSVMVCASLFKYQIYSLVSKHSDGKIIESFVRKYKSKIVRGSSSDGGAKAIREILKILKPKRNRLCIIPDGPRGPNMQINGAVVDIALKTGSTIIPISYSAKYAKFTNSWDNLLIPRLFNHITVKFGDPIKIDRKASKETIEVYKKKLEDSLNEITWELDKKYGHKRIEPGRTNIKNDTDI